MNALEFLKNRKVANAALAHRAAMEAAQAAVTKSPLNFSEPVHPPRFPGGILPREYEERHFAEMSGLVHE